ncbi:leucine-rich_repeat domain-containing protein [Hexamita inflata]|uniref:Leucine-rich repeat domain-containing protein n=1 Tax=Hexamita inflata TaxID=28002 RepID=A0AA86Q0P3_9EUKA|nr:leucine-rich repeat domain-containing protein [Hexamita inflata]
MQTKEIKQLNLDLSGKAAVYLLKLKDYTDLEELNISYMNLQIEQQQEQSEILDQTLKLPTLQKLQAYQCQLQTLSFLKNLSLLKYLDLHLNTLTDIQPIQNLLYLEYLNLSANPIGSIQMLLPLKHLQQLLISSTQTQSLKGVENMKDLIILDAQNNKIELIDELGGLYKMQIQAEINYRILWVQLILQIQNNLIYKIINFKIQMDCLIIQSYVAYKEVITKFMIYNSLATHQNQKIYRQQKENCSLWTVLKNYRNYNICIYTKIS